MAFDEFPNKLVQINKSGHNIKHLVAVSDNQNMPLSPAAHHESPASLFPESFFADREHLCFVDATSKFACTNSRVIYAAPQRRKRRARYLVEIRRQKRLETRESKKLRQKYTNT
jgi:selenocysteine-specific translation elongation factor